MHSVYVCHKHATHMCQKFDGVRYTRTESQEEACWERQETTTACRFHLQANYQALRARCAARMVWLQVLQVQLWHGNIVHAAMQDTSAHPQRGMWVLSSQGALRVRVVHDSRHVWSIGGGRASPAG